MTTDPRSPARDPRAPVIERATRPYWENAAKGRLVIQSCETCGENFHYPRSFCPFCASDELGWVECSGEGSIYSYTIAGRAASPASSVVAYVTLQEGPTVLAGLVGVPAEAVAIGLPVKATFAPAPDGTPLLLFTARDGHAAPTPSDDHSR